MNPADIRVLATVPGVLLWLALCATALGLCVHKRTLRPLLVAVLVCYALAGLAAVVGWFLVPFPLMAIALALYCLDLAGQPRGGP